MTLAESLHSVKEKYGRRGRSDYITASGKMIYVVAAEQELRAIPAVKFPEQGIGLLASEVKELAHGSTIEAMARRKNPELFLKELPAALRF